MFKRKTRIQPRRSAYKSSTRVTVGPTAVRYLILLLLAAFSLFYLIQSAQGSDHLIQIRNLEQSKGDLGKELTTLEINAHRLQSFQNLNQAANAAGLVPVGNSLETITLPAKP